MIDRDADSEPLAKTVPQLQQCRFALGHRLHCVGQHQRTQPAQQNVLEHRRQLGVHERLATGEADQRCREAARFDLVEVFRDFGGCQINQPVIFWRRFDVTMLTRQIAEGAGVEPECVERFERDPCPPFSVGGHERVTELVRV